MVAIHKIAEGECRPYGLYHATRVPLETLRRKGLRPNAYASHLVHRMIDRLMAKLRPQFDELVSHYGPFSNDYFPLEMSLCEQLALAPIHHSGVLFALEVADAKPLADAASEPERKLRALVRFARERAPDVLEEIRQPVNPLTWQGMFTELSEPYALLRLKKAPYEDDGFFSLLAAPRLPVSGMIRKSERAELRPEARAVLFNGNIPFECLEVVGGEEA